jgi:hypothetical protein
MQHNLAKIPQYIGVRWADPHKRGGGTTRRGDKHRAEKMK